MIHSNINISEPPKTLHHIKQSCLPNQELMLWILGRNRGLRIWLITYAHQLQLQYFQRSCTRFQERERKKLRPEVLIMPTNTEPSSSIRLHNYLLQLHLWLLIFKKKKEKKKASTPIHPDSQTKCNSCNDCSHPGEARRGNQALSWTTEPQRHQLCLGMQNRGSGMQSSAFDQNGDN